MSNKNKPIISDYNYQSMNNCHLEALIIETGNKIKERKYMIELLAITRDDFIGSLWVSKKTPDFIIEIYDIENIDDEPVVSYMTEYSVGVVVCNISHFADSFKPMPAAVPLMPAAKAIDPIRYFYVTYDYSTRRKNSCNKGCIFIRVDAGELFSIPMLERFIKHDLSRDLNIKATTVIISNWKPVLKSDYDNFVNEDHA